MTTITIHATTAAPLATAWAAYTQPQHVTQWNHADPSWHSPHATNDLRVGGRFSYRMEARDGSAGFDFEGTYTAVETEKHIAYTMDDGRTATIDFAQQAGGTLVTVAFDAENTHPLEMQRGGWQSILDNYTAYAERL